MAKQLGTYSFLFFAFSLLAEWTELELLAVESNKMSGQLPTWMGVWTEMEYLAFGGNQFSGTLPDNVFNAMPNLLEVSLHDNNFNGSFDKFNENTMLETLLLQRNMLTGEIQEDTFINVPLKLLDMSYNQIGGQIPYDFYDIQFVSLHNNKITGSLPAPQQGHVVRFFSVFNNQVSGELPENIGDLERLSHLDLSQNQFGGSIPTSINDCQYLTYLYLGDNGFSGDFPDISNLTRLQELSLRNMGITGSVPDFLGTWLTRLVFLDLRDNALSGELPASMQNLESVQFLLLSGNQLTGTLPDELWYMQQLQVFALDNNGLTGDVGDICRDDGPKDLDWFAADTTVTCNCCSEQCSPNSTGCGGSTILSPNIDFGYERLRFVLNANLIFDANLKQTNY